MDISSIKFNLRYNLTGTVSTYGIPDKCNCLSDLVFFPEVTCKVSKTGFISIPIIVTTTTSKITTLKINILSVKELYLTDL